MVQPYTFSWRSIGSINNVADKKNYGAHVLKNHYLGYVFASLWVIGLVCTIVLFSMFARSFRTRDFVEEDVTIAQPAKGKLLIEVMNGRNSHHYYSRQWYGINWDNDWPLYGDNYDTLLLNTVRVDLVKSKDSSFHVHRLKFSRGHTQAEAQALARKINFDVEQQDSILLLPNGFGISQHEKFRNQQLLLVVEVPVGKKIEISGSVHDYNWFTINVNRRNGFYIRDYDENSDWGDTYGWNDNTEYIMTKDGLERTNKKNKEEEENKDENDNENKVTPATPKNDGGYRYKSNADSSKEKNKKDIKSKDKEQKKATKEKTNDSTTTDKPVAKIENNEQISSPVYLLTTIL